MADNYTYEARYYDVQQQKYMDWILQDKVDFVLWATKNYIGSAPKEILELACGTGFHGIAFAKRGFNVHGIDIAPDMLKAYEEKLKDLKLQDKITLTEGDLCSFDLKKEFPVAVSLFNELYEIQGKENVEKALKNIYDHLDDNGILVVFLEEFRQRESLKKDHATWTGFHEADGIKIQRTINEDIKNGVMHWESFSVVDDNGKMSTIYTKSDFTLWGFEGFQNFFKKSGFRKIDCYSDLKSHKKYKPGDRFMIFLAQK